MQASDIFMYITFGLTAITIGFFLMNMFLYITGREYFDDDWVLVVALFSLFPFINIGLLSFILICWGCWMISGYGEKLRERSLEKKREW